MGVEIERKFLVANDLWKKDARNGVEFRQGYLSSQGTCSVRVRREGDKANINIKSATLGISRSEFEYPIPADEADELLDLFCTSTVIKTRYLVAHSGKTWEVDVFQGDNAGLVVAEVELKSIDEEFELPAWVGEEVSADVRYYNTELARHPYNTW
jgi:adenylate cyclase